MAPIGGRRPVIGTNPISYAVPAPGGEIAFLVDQSATAVAWTAVRRAADSGTPIPLGWALDSRGYPTKDARAALAGSMAPAGGVKGFSIGLLVEVLCAALAGGNLGCDQGSFTENDGKPINNGQFFIAINPERFSGGSFSTVIDVLMRSISDQEGARLPNSRRETNKARMQREGLTIDADLLRLLKSVAN